MKIYANNGYGLNIGIWGYKKGEFRPRQTYKAIDVFHITINGEEITVYYNKSKSSIDYYYLEFNDLWHYTIDDIKSHARYTT